MASTAAIATEDVTSETSTKSNFRLQNQKMLLTYKTHVDKNAFKGFFVEKFGKTYKPTFFEIAHETADESNPYLHSHILIDWGKAFQSKDCRIFDIRDLTDPNIIIHPHIQPLKSKLHWRNAIKYIAKEDPSLAHLKLGVSIVDTVWNCESLEDALTANLGKFSDVPGIISLYRLKPSEKQQMSYEPFTWQTQLLEKITKPTSCFDRKIIWCFEKTGGTGKSYFGEYWFRTDPKRFYYVNQLAGAHHFATIMKTAVSNGWNGHCLFVDLTRSHEDHSIYIPIEMAKSGLITATKYEGGTIDLGRRPHIVIFANWPPDVSKLSMDRWDINHITPKNQHSADSVCDYILHALNITEARAAYGDRRNQNWYDVDDIY